MEIYPSEGYYSFNFSSSLDWRIDIQNDSNNSGWLTFASETSGKANLVSKGQGYWQSSENNTITFYVLPNNSGLDRSITITATLSNNITKKLTITQYAAQHINLTIEGSLLSEINKCEQFPYLKISGHVNGIDERTLAHKLHSIKYLDLSQANISNEFSLSANNPSCIILPNAWNEFRSSYTKIIIIKADSKLETLTIISVNSIYCHLRTPPKLEISQDAFSYYSTLRAYVPKNCKWVYELAEGWATIAEKGEIIEMDY